MNSQKQMPELMKSFSLKWLIPIYGILIYWKSKNDFLIDNKIIIERKGQVIKNRLNYVELSTGSADFWVTPEYKKIFNFRKTIMMYTLFIPHFIFLVFFIIFNFQPLTDFIVWKIALKNQRKKQNNA